MFKNLHRTLVNKVEALVDRSLGPAVEAIFHELADRLVATFLSSEGPGCHALLEALSPCHEWEDARAPLHTWLKEELEKVPLQPVVDVLRTQYEPYLLTQSVEVVVTSMLHLLDSVGKIEAGQGENGGTIRGGERVVWRVAKVVHVGSDSQTHPLSSMS